MTTATSAPVAEAAIIAGLVNCGDPTVIGRYVLDNRLDLECFTIPAFRAAFDAAINLAADNRPVDIPILAQHLDAGALAAVDSACREHVSAANFSVYAKLLKDAKAARADIAARDWLVQAAQAGRPAHELLAIAEGIGKVAQESTEDSPRFQWAEDFCQNVAIKPALIEGHIPAETIGVIFGDSEAYKSFLLIDIAGHIATGKPWRGNKVKQGTVVFIAGEGGNGLRTRIEAWFERHGERKRNLAVSTAPLELCDPSNAELLIADIKRFIGDKEVSLIVLDTLNTHFGNGDENNTKDMTAFLKAVKKLQFATGATVAIAHHCGHADKTRQRGNISLKNGADWEFRLERSGDHTTLINTKFKDDAKPAPLSWTLAIQPLKWATEDRKPINGAVLEPSTTASTTASTRGLLTRPQRLTLEALDTEINRHSDDGFALIADWRRAALEAGITQSESRQGKHAAFQRAVDALVDAGLVTQDGYRFRPAKPSTRQQTSTTRQQVDFVDAGNVAVNSVNMSTHPLRGVDVVDVDAKPQHAAEGEQENRNHPGDWTPPAEPPPVDTKHHCAKPDGAIAAQWRNSDEQANRTKPDSSDTLAGELAQITRLDVAKLLAGDFGDSDWTRIATAQAQLSERRPDAKADISMLLARIDAAFNARVVS